MKQFWNTFCDDISKHKRVKELIFEKNIVSNFLQALGWSRYYSNLEEQSGVYGRKWIPDFVFYLNNDTSAKEIILELKKPDHKQQKKDIEQIEAYMKLTDCRFGLYFGEKMEVFYLEDKEGKRSAVKVTTIDWVKDNEAGIALITLLKFDSYNRTNLEKFCEDHLLLNSYLKVWNTSRGKQMLYDGIVEHFSLPSTMRNTLTSVLKFQILENPEGYNHITQPVETKTTLKVDTLSHVGIDIPRLFNMPTLKRYFANINSEKTRDIMRGIGITQDISEINELSDLSKLLTAIKLYEKENNIHHTHSSALSRYMDYIKAGLTYEDMKHDAMLVKVGKCGKIETTEKKPTILRPSFRYNMAGIKDGDRIIFDALNIEVIARGENKVEYNGQTYSLTGFCKSFLPDDMRNISGAYNGTKYFSHNGKTLWQKRLEKEKKI